MPKLNGKNLLFGFIMAILTLVACDLFVGLYVALVERPSEMDIQRGLPASGSLPVAHPYKSYMNRPGSKYWTNDSGAVFSLNGQEYDYGLIKGGTVVNEFGHQVLPADIGLEARPKKPDESRIIFLGGSTTFQPWPHLTAVLLNQRAGNKRRYIAINAGTGGYTSQENVIDLMISGFAYNPDIVVAYLPVNDIYWAAYYPEFKRDYSHMRIPLQIVSQSAISKPEFRLPSYPFTLKLLKWQKYKADLMKHIDSISLSHHTTTNTRALGEMSLDESSWRQTVDAVIENILNMEYLCRARNVRLILVTQKFFSTSNPYYTYMDHQVMRAVREITSSPRLAGLEVLPLHEQFPDQWDGDSIKRVNTGFPKVELNFDQGMAYDSMHFTPAALCLFASIMADQIQ